MTGSASMPAPRIAVQLYSLRTEAARDLRSLLETVGRIGYLGVELAGLHGNVPRDVRSWLADLDLIAVSAHAALLDGADAAARTLDELVEVGLDTVVVPWAPPDRFQSLEGVASVAAQLDDVQRLTAARGMSLGYHNHHFELASTIGGQTALSPCCA
jgi:sugar phosphate isomerase/epimerase